ncbi:hypothetical protein like AT4G29090 [Hibiscus trionum]|uniref:Reverse transcriptase n=1 Tax=Hibiscus trionum TaxID=183268 RepID=A0A9W7GZC8_HIBTR|nr:hypothetical protein like AT4G29090 [Hibiscus trionum]
MKQGEKKWDEDLIKRLFVPTDATDILSIVLPESQLHDKRVWRGEKTGLYTVRSGYRMLLNESHLSQAEKEAFRSVWNVQCPPKIRIFLWKSLWNYLPTLQNLHHKRIAINTNCLRCNGNTESIEHVLRDCPFTHHVWQGLGVTWPANVDSVSYFEWLSWLFKQQGVHSRELITYTVWAIWTARNKHMHEGKFQNVQSLITYILGCVSEYKSCMQSQGSCQLQIERRWSPPPEGYTKRNADACCLPATKKAFSGFVLRNNQGKVLGSGIKNQRNFVSVFLSEATALKEGVKFALNLGFENLIVESDSRTLIEKLEVNNADASEIRTVIVDIKHLVRDLPHIRFSFSPRSGNKAAHVLASLGKAGTEGFWVGDAPAPVMHAIEADRTVVPS